MKITALETLRLEDHPSLLHVHVHTDEGLTGLGETFVGPEGVEAFIHEIAAPKILGEDPLRVEYLNQSLVGFIGGQGTGIEQRGRSALDIAMWDIVGKAANLPLYQLFGGAFHETIPVYNSCAGYNYGRGGDAWRGLGEEAQGKYEDLDAAFNRPEELAESLLSEGIRQAKLWPFDRFAIGNGGTRITAEEINQGVEPIRRIREAVGSALGVMVELHGVWNIPCARRIAAAVEEFEPVWIEDPVRADSPDRFAAIANWTRVPVAGSESLSGRASFRGLLDRNALGVAIADVSWCGGLTEARKIAALADTYSIPFAPHDCSGPVVLAASVHLCASTPNAIVQEFARSFYSSWYSELVTELPTIDSGHIRPLSGPGLGTELQPAVKERARVRRTAL